MSEFIIVVGIRCGALSNGDGLHWLDHGCVSQASGWRELPGSEDKIDAGRGLPALQGVAGRRG